MSDETLENDGEALFEKNSSYGRSFIAVNEFDDLTTSEFVSRYIGIKPDNVWSGLKHSRRALTVIHDVDGTFLFPCNRVVQRTIDSSLQEAFVACLSSCVARTYTIGGLATLTREFTRTYLC